MTTPAGELVVDGDGHVMEPRDLWAARMDARRWGDWVPHLDDGGRLWVGGEVRNGGRERVAHLAALAGVALADVDAAFAKNAAALGRDGGHDPKARLADMDRVGIDIAVLYPSSAMFFGPTDPIKALHDPEFVRDCQRAYNEWLLEYCSADPTRLFGIGAVPLQDIDLAVAEARWAKDNGLRGVFIRPAAYVDDLPLNHRVYDPFWEVCEDLRLAVSLHPAVHVDTPGACLKFGLVRPDGDLMVTNLGLTPDFGGSGLGQAIGNPVDMIVSMGRLIMGGVCERFPRLRFVFLESGGGWCATQLQRMDEQVEEFPLEGRWLSLAPSVYFRRQCYISFDPDEWNLAASAQRIGPDRILWASDYPHPEYRDAVVEELLASIAPLSGDDQRRVLSGNEIDAYALPVASGPASASSPGPL